MAMFTFGDFLLDTTEKRITRDNRPVEIPAMPLAVLGYFVEHAASGRVVTKDELRKNLWRCKVEDVTIRSSLSSIREALRDPAAQPRYLQTHGKEGWRLMSPVYRLHTQSCSLLPPAPGGRYDPAHYVPRPAEERVLLSCLQRPGRPAVLFGPPGAGKRLLIERALEQAARSENAPIGQALRISVRSAAEPPAASLDALLKQIGRILLQASGKPDGEAKQILDSFWKPPILAKQKLRELVLHLLAPPASGPVALPTALVFYEADRLLSTPYQDDVFNMLRAWHEDPFLGSMRLLIETNIPPRLFPLGAQSPLWTKVHRMDVSRINLGQLNQLAELHGMYSAQLPCQRLGELVGWNVYLCRVALFHAAVHGVSLDEVLNSYQPRQRAFGAFADHLEDLSDELARLESAGMLPKPIGPLLQESVDGVTLPPETAWSLLRKGVVAETETRGRLRSRCPLYADYFRGGRS